MTVLKPKLPEGATWGPRLIRLDQFGHMSRPLWCTMSDWSGPALYTEDGLTWMPLVGAAATFVAGFYECERTLVPRLEHHREALRAKHSAVGKAAMTDAGNATSAFSRAIEEALNFFEAPYEALKRGDRVTRDCGSPARYVGTSADGHVWLSNVDDNDFEGICAKFDHKIAEETAG